MNDAAPLIDRRSGPSDRRQAGRPGGRRSTDVMATGLLLGTMFVTGCANGEKLSPLAPSSLDSDVRPEVSAPASPRSSVASPVASEGDDVDVDVDVETDGSDDVDVVAESDGVSDAEFDGESERVEMSDFEINAAVAAGNLVVTPGSATLSVRKTKQFVAKGAKGTVRWSATGGTITSKGLFKAGSKAGTFSVTAKTARQGSKRAKVVVRQVPGVTPPPAGTGDSGTGGGNTGGGNTGGGNTGGGNTGGGNTGGGNTGGGNTGGGDTGGGPTVSGIAIAPGQSIQSAVNANPEGTTFIIKSGVHRRQSIRPKTGNSFIGESGAVLDGENTTAQAIVGHGASRVTVRGLRITNYAPPNLGGALDGVESNGWTVENNEIDHNSNGSARTYGLFVGSDWIVRNNKVHHNGWIGITGWECTGTLIDDNEVYANPATIFTDTVGDTGNMKFYGCGDMVVRNNYVHDSPRFGIWFDRSRPDVTIENNRVVNHGEAGIWYEVSYRGTIRGNRVDNAGTRSHYSSGWLRGGGIQVTNSPDVTVVNNTVTNSLNGIIGLQADGYYHGKYGNNELRNFLVQNNTVVMPKGQTGIASTSGNAVYDSWNNRFNGNTYTASTSTPFQWKGSNLTPTQWKAGPGSADSF
jgi:parallel beta-helix repeat protein